MGTTEIQLTDKGKEIFGVPYIVRVVLFSAFSLLTFYQNIQQMHRDEVPSLPPGFQLLGSTPVTQIQGMILPYEDNPSQTHIFSVQGKRQNSIKNWHSPTLP